MSIWINKTNYLVTNKIHPAGKHWVNDGIVPALLVYQLVRAERGRSLNGSQLPELYFTWYALEMQYLNIKTKAQLLRGAFVCKHQVVVWNTVLSEHFEALCTGKDGLRWVTFFAENVGQLISYYYISGKLEHVYPEKQQDNNEKENGSKHMEGYDARRRNVV